MLPSEQRVAIPGVDLSPEAHRRRLQAVIDATHDAVILADPRGLVTYINPSAERLFGWSLDEVRGRPLTVFMPPRFHELHHAGLARFVRTQKAVVIGRTVELAAARKDATEFPIEISITSWTEAGEPHFAGVIRDVSERVRAEKARQLATEQAREVERLVEVNRFKSQFINNAAHELLTPLAPMRALLHVMRRPDAIDHPAAKKNLEVLGRNIERLVHLTQDILDASRLEGSKLGLHKNLVDVAAIVQEAVESFMAEAARREVGLDAHVGENLTMEADRERLSQILYNLISNALKFTPPRGRIDVSAKRVPTGIEVRVKDSGMGVTPEFIPRLFQPFSRAELGVDAAQPGTGLGLYVTKGLVELHGGSIRCESPGSGQGSTFVVLLPT